MTELKKIKVQYTLSNNTKVDVIEVTSNPNDTHQDLLDAVIGYNSGMTFSISEEGEELIVIDIKFIENILS